MNGKESNIVNMINGEQIRIMGEEVAALKAEIAKVKEKVRFQQARINILAKKTGRFVNDDELNSEIHNLNLQEEQSGIFRDEVIEGLEAEIAVYKGSLQSLNEQLAEKDKEIERLKSTSVCVYCGKVTEHKGDKLPDMIAHMAVCEKHPIPILMERALKAEAELAELRERMKPVEEVYKEHEVWAREWLSTAPVSSRSRMLEFWQAICKTMEGK